MEEAVAAGVQLGDVAESQGFALLYYIISYYTIL